MPRVPHGPPPASHAPHDALTHLEVGERGVNLLHLPLERLDGGVGLLLQLALDGRVELLHHLAAPRAEQRHGAVAVLERLVEPVVHHEHQHGVEVGLGQPAHTHTHARTHQGRGRGRGSAWFHTSGKVCTHARNQQALPQRQVLALACAPGAPAVRRRDGGRTARAHTQALRASPAAPALVRRGRALEQRAAVQVLVQRLREVLLLSRQVAQRQVHLGQQRVVLARRVVVLRTGTWRRPISHRRPPTTRCSPSGGEAGRCEAHLDGDEARHLEHLPRQLKVVAAAVALLPLFLPVTLLLLLLVVVLIIAALLLLPLCRASLLCRVGALLLAGLLACAGRVCPQVRSRSGAGCAAQSGHSVATGCTRTCCSRPRSSRASSCCCCCWFSLAVSLLLGGEVAARVAHGVRGHARLLQQRAPIPQVRLEALHAHLAVVLVARLEHLRAPAARKTVET